MSFGIAPPGSSWDNYWNKHTARKVEPVTKVSECMHDNCGKCRGTGIDFFGNSCIHMVACSCSKCRIS